MVTVLHGAFEEKTRAVYGWWIKILNNKKVFMNENESNPVRGLCFSF